jgi:pimeloyl-ACP methyl ester carboxylesterase
VVQSTHGEDGNKRVPVTAGMHIEWHRELKACGVDAEFDFVTDCGHFTMLDKPEVVNANIERLLERIDIDTATELHNIHMFSSVSEQSN